MTFSMVSALTVNLANGNGIDSDNDMELLSNR